MKHNINKLIGSIVLLLILVSNVAYAELNINYNTLLLEKMDGSVLVKGTGVVLFDLGKFEDTVAYECIVATKKDANGEWSKNLIYILYGPDKGKMRVGETVNLYGALIGSYIYVTLDGKYQEIPAIIMGTK